MSLLSIGKRNQNIRYELGNRVTLLPEKCDYRITLPLIKVEGRADEILRFQSPGGGFPVLSLTLWSVIKETPGVLRFQAIQTSPDEMKIRLEAKHTEEREAVWKHVYVNARDYLTQQGLDNVNIVCADEPPCATRRAASSAMYRQRSSIQNCDRG